MICFKYTKTDGAEYLSHLDLLRHVYRTMRRAGMHVEKSGGYHAHARIFLNNPLAVGVKSVAEYAAADVICEGDFKELFNAHAPIGVRCAEYRICDKNPNYADGIERAEYIASGVSPFDPQKILSADCLVITDLRGREVDVRPRIFELEYSNGQARFVLGCGNMNLRADLFCTLIGGCTGGILKVRAFGKEVF